jgi:hypothetical protein
MAAPVPVPVPGLGDLAAAGFAAAGSAEGRAWIAGVPSLIASLARQWDLTIASEEFRHGYSAVVLPVGQRGRPLVLKLAWPPDRVRGEADALAAWRARGAVELVARDVPRGALLLERLDASRSLGSIPLAEAAAIAGALMRTLAIQAPGSFPWLQATARELAATFQARQRSLAHTLVENGQLDRAKAVAWSFVRSIDYWLWGLENGLTVDPLRCRRIASALAPMADRLPSLTARIEGSVRCWPDHRRGQGGSI